MFKDKINRVNRKFFLLLYLILTGTCCTRAMRPEAFKGTYVSFKRESRHLSPLVGDIAWESGLVKSMFDMGVTAYPTKERWLTHPDGPVRLVRSLFAVNGHNFDVSTNTNYPAVHLGVSTITQLIIKLELARATGTNLNYHELEDEIVLDPEFAQSVARTKKEYETVAVRYDQEIRRVQALCGPSDLKNLKDSRSTALNKLDTQRLYQDWLRARAVADGKKRISEIDLLRGTEKSKAQKERSLLVKQLEGLERAKSGGDYNRVREFAQALIDSQSISESYPEHIAHQILLALLCRKAKTSDGISYYMKKVAQKLSCMHSEMGVDYLSNSCCAQVLENTEILNDAYFFENLALYQIIARYYRGILPKMAEYSIIRSDIAEFADCVETTLRNFCNMVFFDSQTMRFEVAKTIYNVLPAIKELYDHELCKDAACVGSPEVSALWGKNCQHQPFITYRKMVYTGAHEDPIILTAGKETDGFIYGPAFKEGVAQIGTRKYMIVDPNTCHLCEMHPTLRNFTIMLDRFFNLNLFAQTTLEQAFLDPQFNAHYFPMLCSHFALLKAKAWPAHELEMLDARDYTLSGMTLSFEFIDLFLNYEHAEIFAKTERQTVVDAGPTLAACATQGDNVWNSSMEQIVPLFPLSAKDISATHPLRWLLYLDLASPTTKIDMILFCVQKLSDTTLPSYQQNFLVNMVTSLLRLLPQRLDWVYHQKLLLAMTPEHFNILSVKAEFDAIVCTAKERLKGNIAQCCDLPRLFCEFVRKNLYLDEACGVACKLLARSEEFDHANLEVLLTELAHKGKGIS